MSQLVDLYIIVATLGAWLAVSVWGLANLRRFWKTRFYETATATITGIYTRRERWSSGSAAWDTWILTNFTFRFEIGGRVYRGDSGDDFIGSFGAIQAGEKQEGHRVEVLYDPEDPRKNCSSRAGFQGGAFLLLVAQGLLVIAVDQIRLAIPEPREPGIEFARSDFPLAGSWHGFVEEARIGSYSATLNLHNDTPDVPSGRVSYSALGCQTLLRFVGRQGGQYTYREEHEAGQCMGMKTIELSRVGGDLDWRSIHADGTRRGSGQFALDSRSAR